MRRCGLKLPPVSRQRAVSKVSPRGNRQEKSTTPEVQNWAVDNGLAKPKPLAVTVHGLSVVLKSKRQPRSFKASVIICDASNDGGEIPGIPPGGMTGSMVASSQTTGLPLPRSRSPCICMSGGSPGPIPCPRLPGVKPLEPGRASITSRNPKPPKRSKIGTPSPFTPTGCCGIPEALAGPKKVMSGPGARVDVTVGVCVTVGVFVMVAVDDAVRV